MSFSDDACKQVLVIFFFFFFSDSNGTNSERISEDNILVISCHRELEAWFQPRTEAPSG